MIFVKNWPFFAVFYALLSYILKNITIFVPNLLHSDTPNTLVMTEFLKLVARHYLDEIYRNNDGKLDPTGLSRYLFVYPNHRSALFMGQYLSELVIEREGAKGRPIMAPRVTTISEIYSLLSPYPLEDQMSLLFRLFSIFNRRYQAAGGQPETFDKFIFWGQMLLSDFNDIDKYDVSLTPAMHRKMVKTLYSVVTDHKEVDVTFAGLDEELAEVLAEFWTNINPTALQRPMGDTREEKESFLRTWRILYDVYCDLQDDLEKEGVAYEGMLQREVVDRVTGSDEEGEKALAKLGVDRIVFVCLTAITRVDERLLDWLVSKDMAEFCWDWADPRLEPQTLKGRQLPASHAAYFPSQYTRFRNVLANELPQSLVADKDRKVTLIEVPSGVGQAGEARKQLEEWIRQGVIVPPEIREDGKRKSLPRQDHRNPLHTAIVLPDENLLFPMLYQMPGSLQPFNVTMGYSLKQSPVTALMDCLSSLQFDARWVGNELHLNYKSVLALLSHSYLSRLAAESCRTLIKKIHEENLYEVKASDLDDPILNRFLIMDNDPLVVSERLKALMEFLLDYDAASDEEVDTDVAMELEADGRIKVSVAKEDKESQESQRPMVFEGYEREFIYNYLLCIKRLQELLKRYDEVRSSARGYTFFLLLQRLVAGVQVPFSGEPLDGLQVMGVLETRSLDFDNLIILSMNEGIYPAKQQQNTFIPLALREAFGLPSQAHRDSVYAYHFFRMLSRASHVTMIYDSRTEGMNIGEVSRYVLQLKYLCPEIQIEQRSAKHTVLRHDVRSIAVRRDDPQVAEALSRFLAGHGERKLSATAIKDYLACQLRFYLKVIRGLYEQEEIKEGIDASLFGTIVHNTLELLYKPASGNTLRVISADQLEQWIKDARHNRLDSVVGQYLQQAFADVTKGKKMVAYQLIAAEGALDFVINTLDYDRLTAAPFAILGTEWDQVIDYQMTRDDGSSFKVHLRGIYDRLDIVTHRDANTGKDLRVLRIVDYKTEDGSSKMKFASPEELLSSKGSKVAFQVMLYSLLLEHATPEQLKEIHIDPHQPIFDTISPHLYFIRSMVDENYRTPLIFHPDRNTNIEIWDVNEYRKQFEEEFQRVLRDIFDSPKPDTYFVQTDNPKRDCEYCAFAELCRLN